MANLPQSGQSTSMDSLTVTREQFRLDKKDELEFLAQALGNVSGSYTTETVSPTAVVLQGAPTLAAGAVPADADDSLRIPSTSWVLANAGAPASSTAPSSPSVGDLWVDITDPANPILNVWDGTNWVPVGGGASVTVSDTAPTGAASGDLWLDSTEMVLYVWYTDASSSQWVQASGGGSTPWLSTGGDIYFTNGSVLVGADTPSGNSVLQVTGATTFAGGTNSPEQTIGGSFDMALGDYWTAGAITIPNPTNAVAGAAGVIRLTAAPVGWGANFKFPSATPIAPTAFPAVVPYYVQDATTILIGSATEGIA